MPGGGCWAGEADLRQETFNLFEALFDLVSVVGGEVVEGEGEEGLHFDVVVCGGEECAGRELSHATYLLLMTLVAVD